jgi:hypothetical protein
LGAVYHDALHRARKQISAHIFRWHIPLICFTIKIPDKIQLLALATNRSDWSGRKSFRICRLTTNLCERTGNDIKKDFAIGRAEEFKKAF